MTRVRRWGGQLGHLAIVLVLVTATAYLLVQLLPGDPGIAILGPNSTPEERAEVVRGLGLDRPLVAGYLEWLAGAVQGDIGTSARNGLPVSELIVDRAAVSIQLLIVSQLLALAIAIPWGIAMAYRAGTRFDRLSTTTALGFLAVPNFVLGLALIYVFAIQIGVLPATGWVPLTEDPIGNLRAIILPAVALATSEVAVYARLLRSDLITTLQYDFVGAARSHGFSDTRILVRHALRPSVLPLVTVAGLNVGRLVGGAVIIENLFALPGLGRLLVDAIAGRDYLVVQGVVLVIAVGYVLVNFLVDRLYVLIDPRLRHYGGSA